MKLKIAIIIVLSLLITLPSVAFAEKIQPEDEAPAAIQRVAHHPDITPAQRTKTVQVKEEQISGYTLDELKELDTPTLKKIYLETEDSRVLDIIESRWHPTVSKETGSKTLDTEVEPNDDWTTANAITDSMAAAIDPGGDVDYFSFAATAGLAYTFETHDLPGSSSNVDDTKMYLYDTDGTTQLAYDDDGGTGYYSLITYTIETDGTYYVKVVGYGSSYTGDYLLTMTSQVPPTDPYEPNNTLADATTIASGDSLVGPMIDPGGDIDLYVFTGTAGYAVRAETCPVDGETMDTKLYLLAADSTQLAYNDDGGEGLLSLITGYELPADGTYYLKATGYSGSTTGFYNMKLDLLPPSPYAGVIVINEIMYNPIESGTDTTEFVELYNAGASAVNLEGFEFTQGFDFIFPAGASIDPDGYLVVAKDQAGFTGYYGFPADYIWTSGSLSNGGEDIEIMDAGDRGLKVDYVDYDDNAPWPVTPDGDGPSLELIDPAYDNALAASWQASWVIGGTPDAVNSTEPDYVPDAYEPNNTSLEAAYIPPGTYDLSLSSTQDEYDWFYCPVSAGDTVNVQISFDDTQCDFDLFIYNKDGTEVDYSGSITSPEEVEYVFPADDTLYILADGYSGEGPYTMVFTINSPPVISPWMEGFEGYSSGDIPINWMVFDDDANGYKWVVNTYGAYEGDNCMKVGYNSSGNDDWLVTPRMLVTPGDLFSFMTKAGSSYYNPETFEIWISTANEITSSADFTTCIDTVDLYDTDYIKYYTDLSAYAGQLIYVAIRNISVDMMSQYVDNVALELPVPKIALSDTVYDFGMIEEGTTASFDVTITNDGGSDLIVTGATVNPPFYCDYTGTIPPGGSDVALIDFAPIQTGFYSEALVFNSNAGKSNDTIELSGIAYGTDYVVEGFEALEFPPFGWSNPDGYWKRFTNDAYEGDGYARVSWYHEDDAILYSPHLIIEAGDLINFYWINANLYDGKDGKVTDADITYFEISNDGTNWQVLATLNPEEAMTEYEFVCVAVPDDYIGINAKVRWRHVTENIGESRGVGLDNVMLPQPYLPVNFYLDPYTQSDYNSIGATVAYDIDIYNTGIQADRYYISLAGSKTRGKDVEDFESDDGGYVGTGLWQWGSPTSGPGNAHSGVNVWATNLSGDYGTYANYTLDSPEIAIGSDEPTLTFWHWYDTENSYDGGNVKISTDGGATWTVIEPVGGYPGTSNSSNPLYPDPIFCGHGQGFWEQVTFGLSAYAGETASFRWHFGSDGSVQYPGWYIDDVDITSGGGPPPPPEGWPVTFSDDYLDIEPGEMGTFTASVEIPDDGGVIEDDVNTSTIYVESREDPLVNHEADVVTTAHPKDPYEPNNVIVDATPWAYGEITEGAQIYYNPDYADKDIDIYEFSGLAGDIILCDFILPPDETEFDGAIKLVDVDSTEIAIADEWAGGGSEQLKFRLILDGDYFLVLGKWDNVYVPSKKDPGRGVNTCFYTMSLELIPSPDIAVSPDSLQLGIIASKETASVDMYIENTGVTGCEDLTFNIDVVIPGVEVLLYETFDDPIDWTTEGGTNWGIAASSNAGGVPPEAKFSWSPSTTSLQRLISPVLNTTGYTSLPLSFKHYVNDYNGDYTIGVSTTSDGGVTWNDVWSTSPSGNIGPETFALTLDNADVGSANFQVCWYFDGNSFNINYWYIDDVDISTGTPWCTVEPLAGSIGQGAIQTCVVTCDETGLTEPGIYTADIIVHNNALLNGASDVTIPLTFFYQVAAQGLQGTVTFEVTGEPIDSVKVSAGNYVTYTNEDGFYQFTDIASGIYDVVFEKDGFATLTRPGIYVSPNWVTLLDVEMLFDGPVPVDFTATGIQEAIELDWVKPGGGGGGTEYEIIYDDGVPENATAWYDAGNMNAVRFTPDGYPCTIISADMNVYDGSWPVGSLLQPFEVAVFDDDGTGALPGTELGRVTVTPTHYDFIDVDLSSLGISIDAGDFYIAHIQGGAYPNCLPTAIDETLPTVNRSYSRYVSGGGDWALSDYQDFMIRATVNGPRGTNELKNQIVTFPSNGMTKEMFVNGSSPRTLEHYVDPRTGNALVGNGITRDIFLLGYNVYEETKGFVAYVEGENNTDYLDDIVAVGVPYTYWATAVYDAGESAPSNTDTAIPLPAPPGYHEPFDVNWSTTGWTTAGSPNNWQWSPGHAVLNWSPSVAPYDMSLISPNIVLPPDPLDVYDLTVSMYLSNYSSNDGEVFEIWLIHDSGEDLLWDFDDPTANWGVSGGTDWVYTDTGQYAGQTVQIKFRSHGGTTFNFNYWYIYDVLFDYAQVLPDYGALAGTVTDGYEIPLEGVAVDADLADYNTVYTDADGFYSIDPMRVGLYDVTFSKEGYTTIIVEDVEILIGETTLLNVILGNPTMDILPTSIPDATVPVGGTSTRTITVTNNGNAPLDWDASIENLTDTNYSINYDLQTNPPTPGNSEMAPFGYGIYEGGNKTKDTWDILYNFNCQDAGQPGIETNGQHIFTSDWRSAATSTFWKYDMDGTFVESFNIPGVTCIRDMAYDGTYFYGSPASTTIYIVDLENQTQIGTISVSCAGVTGVRHIAYDPELDGGNGGFWIGNWDQLGAITMSGTQIYGNINPTVVSLYGSAYDQFTADGPYLWLFSQEGSGVKLAQFEIATQSFTGVTHDATDIPGFNAGIAGGAATYITPEGIFALLVNIQQDPNLIGAYELCVATPPWITLDPTSGTIPPGDASQDVTVYFDAGDDPAGTIHTCDILFESVQGVDPVTVPVTLTVGELEYGILTGTVTAATGGAPIEGAEIKADTYVTYSDQYGFYEIPNMIVGYYTVECTAVGYNDQVVYDVEIVVDLPTTQDFALLAPIMVVDPTSLNVNVPPGSTLTEYITINNNGDGPMDFDVTLYDYGKVLTDYSNCTVGGTIVSQNGVPTGPGNSSGFQADGTKDEVIIHYDGENNDGIGLTAAGGGTFMVAARFTSTELGAYYDTYEIIGTEIFINDDVTSVILKVWEGGSFGDPGSEVYSEDVTSQIIIGWNTIDLISTVPLLSGNEYWVGYEVTHVYEKYPAGCDAGPAVDGKGDWIYLAPGPWNQLHVLVPTLDYNWNIRMVIDLGTPPWITVDPLFGTIPAFSSMDIAVMFDATDLTLGEIKTADIEIVPTPDVGTVTVSVELTVSDTVSGDDTPVTETKLYANFPNPMLNTTTFKFSLKERSHVTLTIYNVKGQLVETLLNDEIDSTPEFKVEWDGTANGKKLANGIYFYKLETNSKTFLNKMILMK